MINNRQTGRRRGRGGQRPQNGGGRGPESGNRIDNRARGNAPQLLEKYKTLARDAQMQGDRVLTEYYLQFADHYFRVVAESRARFEESRPQRRDEWQSDDDMGEGADGNMSSDADDSDDSDGAERPQERQSAQNRPEQNRSEQNRSERGERPERVQRNPRQSRNDQGRDQNRNDEGRDGNRDGAYAADRPQRSNRERTYDDDRATEPTLSLDVLPPALGVAEMPHLDIDDDVPVAPAPKRRARTPRAKAEDAAEA